MRIHSIKYRNYRCFRNVTLDFTGTTSDKNIFMIVAPNGGGKTEMLFSFQWVLYGFDFTSLHAKENTPWSLNSTLYHALKEGDSGDSRTASVEMEFEENGRTYTIKRSEKFTKKFKGDNLWSSTTVEFSETNSHGVRSTPVTDEDLVIERLSRIIPLSILQGIIFDGERMKGLSQADDQSKKAVEGVFRQITNVVLFERCAMDLKSLLKDNNKAKKLQSIKSGNETSTELLQLIKKNKELIERKQTELQVNKCEKVEVENRLKEISHELSENAESRRFEELRNKWRDELELKEKTLDKYMDYLYKDLDDGWLLMSDSLFDDVEHLLDTYDIPAGLTVTAVRNILTRSECICGRHFDDESRKVLEDLISQLPPDNVNSAIGEMVHSARMAKNELKDKLGRSYAEIHRAEKDINALKDKIADISTQITEGASEYAQKLEEENVKKLKRQGALDNTIRELEESLKTLEKDTASMEKRQKEVSSADVIMRRLNAREAYLNKCLSALNAIEQYNKELALRNINRHINDCYKMLSEDYANGRRLYIVQFDKAKRYHLASYLEDKFQKLWAKDGTPESLLAYQAAGMSEREVREHDLMKVLESNSTGQAKINTLAFAKAILDYSRKKRDKQEAEISHSFPFLIDSPFTELSDGNLMMSAKSIHLFSEQVILMISNESLDSVRDHILPHVGKTVYLSKNAGDASSSLMIH